MLETRFSNAYKAKVTVVGPVVQIDGLEIGFKRSSRPNGSDTANWNFKDCKP